MKLFNILILLVICCSCNNITIIEGSPDGKGKSLPKTEEQISVKELEDCSAQIISKNSTLSNIEAQVELEKQDIDNIYNQITAMNLLDESEDIGLIESNKLFDLHSKIDSLKQRIKTANLIDLGDEIKELAETAQKEQIKLPDSKEVLKLADQIKSIETAAKASMLKIKAAENSLAPKKDALEGKIDEAGKNFKSHFGSGDKKVDLDALLTKLRQAKTLKDINDILSDKNFFSLKAEIKSYDPNFDDAIKKVSDLFGDGLASGLIKNANDQKATIDARLALPASWELLTQNAVELDRLLENGAKELENAAQKRVTTSAMDKLSTQLTPVIAVPLAKLNQHKTNINNPVNPPSTVTEAKYYFDAEYDSTKSTANINFLTGVLTSKTPGSSEQTTAQTLLDSVATAHAAAQTVKLEEFYDATRLTAIKQAVNDAGDKTSPVYQKSYQSFIDALKPYTMPEILKIIDDGLASAHTEKAKKAKLHNNLKKLKSILKDTIYKKLMTDKAAIIKNKTDFLITAFKSDLTIDNIEKEFSALDAVPIKSPPNGDEADKNAFIAACNNLLANLNTIVLTDKLPDCTTIFEQPTVKAKDKISGKISESKNIIKEQFEKLYLGVLNSTIPADLDEQKTEDDFIDAVEKLNTDFLQDTSKINTASAPYLNAATNYTTAYLRNDIKNTLETFNFGTSADPYTYQDVIEAYQDELNPAMTSTDIVELYKVLQDKKSTQLFSKLHLVLSNSVRTKVVEPFIPISDDKLITNMKKAASDGIADFYKAEQDVKNASTELARRAAILHLASFFNDNGPANYRSNIGDVANNTLPVLVPLNTNNADISAKVAANKNYKTLGIIAAINPANIDAQLIKAKDTADGSSLAEIATALSPNMKTAVFGSAVDVVSSFDQLCDRLRAALLALKSAIPLGHSGALVINKTNIEPMVHAFNLVFFSLLEKLDKIPNLSINTHDTEINNILSIFKIGYASKYASKFTGLKSVVFEYKELTSTPGTQRDIFTLLTSLEPKLRNAILARPTVSELAELLVFVENFLR